MHTLNIYPSNSTNAKDFWDDLQVEILSSNQKLSKDEVQTILEQSFVFSLFSRGCSQIELIALQSLLHINDNGYVITIELSPLEKTNSSDVEINLFSLHHYIKEILKDASFAIGPLIANRISILVSMEEDKSEQKARLDGLNLGSNLIDTLHRELRLSVSAGIGNLADISSAYTSFGESLSCLRYCTSGQVLHVTDLKNIRDNHQFGYEETEKYMLDAIRLRKIEAYDYFAMLMDWIRPFNDESKRNRILEIIVLTAHTMRMTNEDEVKCCNYIENAKELEEYTGVRLIEWAYEKFICITGYVKSHNSIDYSNRIVQATKEYLENHYSEDISLEEAAAQVNISPQYFSKLIKKTTGFNFIDWLSTLRVKKAKELLNDPNLTVKEVCFMVGYKDPNYFSRIFKKRIGMTPSEYIKNSTKLNNKN